MCNTYILKEQLFFEEIDRIQLRHKMFFPTGQKQSIQLRNADGMQLHFDEDYDLPDVITMEIKLAFKLVFNDSMLDQE